MLITENISGLMSMYTLYAQVVNASSGMLDSFHEFADVVGILGHKGIICCCKTSDSVIGFCSSLEINSPMLSRSSRNQVQLPFSDLLSSQVAWKEHLYFWR
jgi:hypothetical protein